MVTVIAATLSISAATSIMAAIHSNILQSAQPP